jgi:hypothetical protein
MNIRRPLIAIPLAAAVVLLAAAAVAGYRRYGPIPDTAEAVGPFEIVTHSTRYTSGWNEGRLRRGVTEHYSVRWRGKAFEFEGPGGMFGDSTETYRTVNAVITFPSPEPAFVVNAGDPNNDSHYFLVREVDGRATAQPLGPGTGSVSADWIDPPPSEKPAGRELAVHRKRMAGGRFILLGDWTVLDTRTLRGYELARLDGVFPGSHAVPIAVSPVSGSFARLASGASPENRPMVLVHDFAAGASYALSVDRRTMRYNDLQEIGREWLAHHFEWRRGEGGRDRLVVREGVTPLPYRVHRMGEPGERSFSIQPVKAEMKDTLIAFLQREFAAERLPDEPGEQPTTPLMIGGQRVSVTFFPGTYPGEDARLNVWGDFAQDTRHVDRIADRFDAELRTGKHDALFDP